jgi:hypothetical protein
VSSHRVRRTRVGWSLRAGQELPSCGSPISTDRSPERTAREARSISARAERPVSWGGRRGGCPQTFNV